MYLKSAYCSQPIVKEYTFVPPQLSQQPDPRPSTTPSHVGRSPAANCATEPNTTHTPLTRTVRITRTCLTHMPSSPTGSGTGALMSTLSWAPSREAAHPPPRPPLQDPNTPRNCSLTPPSPPRAARGARAAPRATAPRFPQRHRTVRYSDGKVQHQRVEERSSSFLWNIFSDPKNGNPFFFVICMFLP